jgi:translation initiation factor IF-2
MAIRLNKVTRDLNVGITTVVEFLQKKGYAIEASPNAKITEEQYAELVKEFSTDKNLKKETEKLLQDHDGDAAKAAEELRKMQRDEKRSEQKAG